MTDTPVEITILNRPYDSPWFNALPSNQVADQLMYEEEKRPLLTQQEFDLLVRSLDASQSTLKDWLLTASKPESASLSPRLADIDQLFHVNEEKELTEALTLVRRLHLYSYDTEVATCLHSSYPQVRRHALVILIEWNVRGLGNLLAEALRDEHEAVKILALYWLKQTPYPETFDALCEILSRDNSQYFDDALLALEICGTGKEGDFLLDLFKKKIWESPFQKFERFEYLKSHYSEYRKAAYLSEDENSKKLIEEYTALKAAFGSYLRLFQVLCTSMGKLRSRQAVPFLLKVIESPQVIGLKDLKRHIFDLDWNNYPGILSIVISTLGRIGDRKATKPLLSLLSTDSDYYYHEILDALGNLQDDSAVETVRSFLGKEGFKESVFQSLSKIGTDNAYSVAIEYYLQILERAEEATSELHVGVEESRRDFEGELRGMEQLLISNNGTKFEETIVDLIQRNEHQSRWKWFLNSLATVGTVRSIETLFSLSSNPEHYDHASFILSKYLTHEVPERARKLLDSQNPLQLAFAITVLWSRSNENYIELERYETSQYPEVRRAVASVYYSRKDRMRLRRMANDSDREVRDCVFYSYDSESKARLMYQFVSTSKGCEKGELLCTSEALVLAYGSKVMVVSPGEIFTVGIVRNGENVGLYLRLLSPGQFQDILSTPSRAIGRRDNGTMEIEAFHSALLSLTKCSFDLESTGGKEVLSNLWNKEAQAEEAERASSGEEA